MARITRKELKSDKFAREVGLTMDFFEEHQKDVVRYGGIGAAVVLLIIGIFIYQRHEHSAREEALTQAIIIQDSPVSATPASGLRTFPTQEAKDQAIVKAFTDVYNKYSGSDEGQIAEYYLGAVLADQGNLESAEKNFQIVADKASDNYASLAKNALAEIYFATGRDAQGEKLLRDLIAHPTVFVSKDQATLSLARHLSGKNNAEARKLLSPLKDSGQPSVKQAALMMYSQLPPQ